ncbi:hypothetical protein P3T36_004649 [Kitasatospora sp. MAP12-15]|uniref:hypothetical protein n=1 Tax=unclassified Kitasatospora TaxID=2633591 RepID=UPI0024745A67|nr:hypothetical protein [Kitasatospora sp. MAP12-44]MDH6111495.1 hypothetical protein [Kitasatospora sp. MAP12-44]
MSDWFECALAVRLSEGVTEGEVAELRWHLGLGPRPEALAIVSQYLCVEVDDFGAPVVVEDDPYPLLDQRGFGSAGVDGVLDSRLDWAEEPARGWTLTSRQQLHPDGFGQLGELCAWLALHVRGVHGDDVAVGLGTIRFYEDVEPQPLLFRGGRVEWPA